MAAILARKQATTKRSAGTRARAARPKLKVVARRRRWPAFVAGTVVVVVIGGMLLAAVFHTQLAERQLRIDDLERRVAEERDRFDRLRHERAVLRAPERIAVEAERLGMVLGETGRFVAVDAHAVARQLAAAGAVEDDAVRIVIDVGPLDQFRDVKSVSAGQP